VSAKTVDAMVVNPRLLGFIATRDKRIAKDRPWSPTPLIDAFAELVAKGVVTMGGRVTCGGAPDPTWKVLQAWKEVVRKARTFGYEIVEEPVKHGNAWATKAGGFWNESKYHLVACGGAK